MRWKYVSRDHRKVLRMRRIISKKYAPLVEWHPVFTWWPRKVGDHKVWLETIQRRPSLIASFKEAILHDNLPRAKNIIRVHGFDYRLPRAKNIVRVHGFDYRLPPPPPPSDGNPWQ